MNTVAAPRPIHSNPTTRQVTTRQVLGAGCALVAGCLLFFASRRLAWGRDQSFDDWPLWLLATVPYLAYFTAVRFSAIRFAEFVKRSDFLLIWTVSLVAFVVMRASSLARLYEAGIYDTTVAGITRYAIISAVYICFGFLAVTAWRLMSGRLQDGPISVAARMLGLSLAFLLFCTGIFLIAP